MAYNCAQMTPELNKMYRAIHLSSMAYNRTYPNPRVGAVLVHKGQVIGEGFHKYFGGAHAEEECLLSVKPEDQVKIADSTLYVTLEPCNHVGKRGACTDLILKHNIKKVVVASQDPHPLVAGAGIKKLRQNGVEVLCDVLTAEAISQNLYFYHYHTQHRPYIILKWAEDANRKMGHPKKRIQITAPDAADFVMRWRAETQSILVGAQTAITDNPRLTDRSGLGIDPTRLVIDPSLRAYNTEWLHLHDDMAVTFFINNSKNDSSKGLIKVGNEHSIPVHELVSKFYEMGLLVILVEGGAHTLNHFIQKKLYDEIRVIRSRAETEATLDAPSLPADLEATEEIEFSKDVISYYFS